MKNKKMMAAIAGAVVLILICVLAGRQGAGSNAGTGNDQSGIASVNDAADQSVSAAGTESLAETESDAKQDGDKSGTSSKVDSGESGNKDQNEAKDAEAKGSSDDADKNPAGGAVIDDGQNTSSGHSISSQSASWKNLDNYYDGTSESPEVSPTPKVVDDIAFPYTIPDKNLVVRRIASYDGAFLEDGQDLDVEGIAVIILENSGTQAVEYTEIMLSGSGGKYIFECSDIPAGGVVVVQEKNATAYRDDIHWRRCECAASMLDELQMSENEVKVTENEAGSLLVENISDADIPCVRIFYKFYDEENDAYVGGITYMVKITDLAAGSSTTVTPSHYASGYSRVVMVRTYETAE